MEWKIEMVIHGEHGGFSLTSEIVRRLRERGCAWIDQCVRGPTNDQWYISSEMERDGHFRKDPVFVGVVKELTKGLDQEGDVLLSWKDRRELEHRLLNGLRVVEVRIVVEVTDDDGRETVRVIGGAW